MIPAELEREDDRPPRHELSHPSREAHATLNNFKLNLFGCIILWFES